MCLALIVQSLDGLLQVVMGLPTVPPNEIPTMFRVSQVSGQQFVQTHQLRQVASVHHVLVSARVGRPLTVIPVVRHVVPDANVDHSFAKIE